MRTSYVADWMSTPPILVRPSASLAEAQQIMEHGKVRRLPAVEHGRLIGIMSWGDLHRCENCRHFDGIACMLDRPERQSGVPGQHCQAFALLSEHAISRDV